MPDLNDPNNDKGRLEAAKEELNSLPSEDKRLVVYWLNNGAENYAASTKVNHISHLLTVHDELDTTFADADKFEWTGALSDLADRRDWSDGTKRNYQKSIRALLDDIEDDVVADKDEIALLKGNSGGKIDEDDILSIDEVRTLINDASNRARDQAMFSVMIDLGLRIAAVCSLRIRDFEYEEGDAVAELSLNDDALGQKGSGGRTQVATFSAGHIRSYLRTEHPRPDDPDAPLFHKVGNHYDPDDPSDDGSMSPSVFRRRMRRLASSTDIDESKLHPHNLKHAAVTIWALRGMSDREIEHRAGWARESGQLKRYEHLTGDDINNQILETFGIERSEGESRTVAPIANCPNCKMSVDTGMRFCPQCGQKVEQDLTPEWFEKVVEEFGEEHPFVQKLRDNPVMIKDDPTDLPHDLLESYREDLEDVLGVHLGNPPTSLDEFPVSRFDGDGEIVVQMPYTVVQEYEPAELWARTTSDGFVELVEEDGSVIERVDPIGVE